ncbi:MAG: hypothetical protein DRQ55_20195 [Planctomycetota bacterium]|nr:MAG: hypothetical protein DRQ55_20195 [Planctomycetota bacterium]
MARGYKTGGRQKGTPNKTTAAMRDAIFEAFEQVGGVEYLVYIAEEDPRTFCGLLKRLLPSEARAESQGPSLEDLVVACYGNPGPGVVE